MHTVGLMPRCLAAGRPSDVAHALAVLVEERERLDRLLHLQRARRLLVPIAVPTRSRRHPRNDTTRVSAAGDGA